MDKQADFDFGIDVSSDDMTASFVPACFDDYLVCVRMRQTGSRPDTNSKLQSDYDLPT
jgi:hypothetical protein